jgi:hypothetical protein
MRVPKALIPWVILVAAAAASSFLLPSSRAPAVLAAVLVVVTAWYAWQTQRMVEEMRAARAAQVRPRVVPTLHREASGSLVPRLVNVGSGPAVGVVLAVSLEPDGPRLPYATGFMPPGRGVSLALDRDGVAEGTRQLFAEPEHYET